MRLADRRLWRLLLHYPPGTSPAASEADDPRFFFHPQGHVEPAAELDATLRALLRPHAGTVDDHPACRFPARRLFLDQALGIGPQPPECPALAAWLGHINATAATLVFADASFGDPASMYGHTLLRLDRDDNTDTALLATAVNYAATPDTSNPLLYILFGLSGGFAGRFAAQPYYLKVQEYANINSRNLWEYTLDLTPEELQRLTLHLYEMRQTHFDYFYLRENCSYHLLSLLEVARPRLQLRRGFGLMVLPADTVISVLRQEGLVRRRLFRPSHVTLMLARYAQLSAHEADLAVELATTTAMPQVGTAGAVGPGSSLRARSARSTPLVLLQQLDQGRQVAVLDAAHDYLRYTHGYTAPQDARQAEFLSAREGLLLSRRAAIDLPSSAPPIQEPAAPEDGHGSTRLHLSVGTVVGGNPYLEFGGRLSLHDILDRRAGYIENSLIAAPQVRLRFTPARTLVAEQQVNSLLLRRFDLVRVMSIAAQGGWVRRPSWRLRLGAGLVEDLPCSDWSCTAADLSGGLGVAVGTGHQVLYGFADVYSEAGPAFHPGFRLGIGATWGVILEIHPSWRVHGEAAYRYDFAGDRRAGPGHLRLSAASQVSLGQHLGLRLSVSLRRRQRQVALALHYYY